MQSVQIQNVRTCPDVKCPDVLCPDIKCLGELWPGVKMSGHTTVTQYVRKRATVQKLDAFRFTRAYLFLLILLVVSNQLIYQFIRGFGYQDSRIVKKSVIIFIRKVAECLQKNANSCCSLYKAYIQYGKKELLSTLLRQFLQQNKIYKNKLASRR